MLTVKSDYHKMESYAKKKPFIFGIIAFSILIVTLAIITIIVVLTTNDACKNNYSDDCLYAKMIFKKGEFPEHRTWTNANCYWSSYLGNGCGCAGFAYIMSDVCFGTLKTTILKDCPNFKVGDVVRINSDTHSVIILKIDHKTNIITIAEGNYAGSVHWGRTFTTESLKKTCNYIQRRNPNYRISYDGIT